MTQINMFHKIENRILWCFVLASTVLNPKYIKRTSKKTRKLGNKIVQCLPLHAHSH